MGSPIPGSSSRSSRGCKGRRVPIQRFCSQRKKMGAGLPPTWFSMKNHRNMGREFQGMMGMADPTLGIPGWSFHPDHLEKWDKLGIPPAGMTSTTLSKHFQHQIVGDPGSGSWTTLDPDHGRLWLHIPSWDPAVSSAPRKFPHYSLSFLPSFSVLD